MPKLPHPVPLCPGELLQLSMSRGYSYLVVVEYPKEPANIVAGYTTQKAADKARDAWKLKLADRLCGTNRLMPTVTSANTLDWWNHLRLANAHESWLKWLADAFILSSVSSNRDTMKLSTMIGYRLSHQHRTMQQTTIRAIHEILRSYHASEPGQDERNSAAVKWVESVLAIPAYMPYV